MKYYRLYIYGYGGESILGSITEAQWEFWKDLEEIHLITHMINPHSEDDDNPVWDCEDPRWLGDWFELDSILHTHGANPGSASIEITEVSNTEWDATTLSTVLEYTFWKEFLEQSDPKVTYDEEEIPQNVEYVFCGQSHDKGCFGEYTIATEGDLDLSKLHFIVTELPTGDEVLELIDYDGQEVFNDGGDTNGKGMSAQVWKQ